MLKNTRATPASNGELERLWRSRLQACLRNYRAATADWHQKLWDYRRGSAPSPDGAYALASAQKAERLALQEYRRVMRICTDLVLRGKHPPENGWVLASNSSETRRKNPVRAGSQKIAGRTGKTQSGGVFAPATDALTTREREVLTLIASGKTTRDIAQELGIAFKTVAVHRSRLMLKLGAGNMADLTRAAIRMELIAPY